MVGLGKFQAAALIVGNRRPSRALPKGVRGRIQEVVLSGALLGRRAPKAHPVPVGGLVRFVVRGRLVDWKGAQYLVSAFARMGLQKTVTVHHRLSLERSIELMREGDVY